MNMGNCTCNFMIPEFKTVLFLYTKELERGRMILFSKFRDIEAGDYNTSKIKISKGA